jgi:hypothetical protein
MPINPEILAKLGRLYGKKPLTADMFGRRPATAKEIAQTISQTDPKFDTATIEQHLPTKTDLTDKED